MYFLFLKQKYPLLTLLLSIENSALVYSPQHVLWSQTKKRERPEKEAGESTEGAL